jgi:hypothetical protein
MIGTSFDPQRCRVARLSLCVAQISRNDDAVGAFPPDSAECPAMTFPFNRVVRFLGHVGEVRSTCEGVVGEAG